MIEVEELIGLVEAYNPVCDAEMIRRAYAYGLAAHEGQFRHSGEPYFSHPIAVAALLTEVKLDDATIITALLHDTIEDTKATYKELAMLFTPEIAELVDGVTKLTNLELSSVETKQAENFRKLLLAMSKDLRVLLVKLADRLHNMRTIKAMDPEKQQQKAHETMEIYAPLAGRMGMQYMREELEDLCFRVLNPDARNSIMRRFINLRNETGDLIPQITEDIRKALDTAGVDARVKGREKRPYSIWRKMQENKEGFNRLSDIYGFRIITDNVQDAYVALGAVHQRWSAVPGRFKDYISQPKSNGYRSIQTTVSGRNAKRVEIQIRTEEMNQVAESGIAAHWSYRDGQRVENRFTVDPFSWLRSLAERFEASENPDEFLEHVKLDMFNDQVFCFTPKGEVIKLPRGATPIDFAYAIHTALGDSCVGAKVDGQRVPLWTRLRNGQSVDVIRAEGQRPQASWEEMVVTGRAKSAIRKYLREENRDAHIRLGREIARVSFERINKKATDKALLTAAKAMQYSSADELLACLGAAEITGHDVLRALYPELVRDTVPPIASDDDDRVIGLQPDQSATAAPCCGPVPGERIVGIAVRGRGVVIHSIECGALEEYENDPDKWIDLRWTLESGRACNNARLVITMANDAGVLGRICTLIGEHRANIVNIDFTDRKPDFYRMRLEIMVRDIEHLTNIQTAIEADSDIAEVKRYRNTSFTNDKGSGI
ncbi:MAG: bifunctional (p)ppGpp synthetase/guanosine-3',5'-bis(diphosphate) 3'-pyrophosphohydrolase [Rhodobacteraceae bacterium]|nr:bifunctional (p)ppGpp synthetase/guanosine-3',5'-bis(diphosphate) 3'-pyrophosphohydrolase [Paracoccaceae bacterium]